jgi:hypothetical protein
MESPYIVEIDGVPVRCESAEAALDLIRLHSGSDTSRRQKGGAERQSAPNGSRWNDKRIAEFFKHIEGKQRKIIDALLEHEDRTDAQLLQLLNFQQGQGSALGGVLAGLWKNAKKVGADPNELYMKKPITIGDKKAFAYSLHDAFRDAAARRPAK